MQQYDICIITKLLGNGNGNGRGTSNSGNARGNGNRGNNGSNGGNTRGSNNGNRGSNGGSHGGNGGNRGSHSGNRGGNRGQVDQTLAPPEEYGVIGQENQVRVFASLFFIKIMELHDFRGVFSRLIIKIPIVKETLLFRRRHYIFF